MPIRERSEHYSEWIFVLFPSFCLPCWLWCFCFSSHHRKIFYLKVIWWQQQIHRNISKSEVSPYAVKNDWKKVVMKKKKPKMPRTLKGFAVSHLLLPQLTVSRWDEADGRTLTSWKMLVSVLITNTLLQGSLKTEDSVLHESDCIDYIFLCYGNDTHTLWT